MLRTYTYCGNDYTDAAAGTTTFALTSTEGNAIPYLQRAHIHVYISDDDGDTWVEQARPAAWDFNAEGTSIVLEEGIEDGEWVRVLRITPILNRFVDFADGSLLTAAQLDQGEDYSRFSDQELFDQIASATADALRYQGSIDLTADNAPADPQVGWVYLNTGDGDVIQGGDPGWAGIVGDEVSGGEQVVYQADATWAILQTPVSQVGVLSVTGVDPIAVDNTDAQRPVVSFDGQLDVIVQDDAPDDPEEGWLWFSTTDNRLYVYTGNEWVDASPMGTAACSIGANFPLAANSTPGDLFWHTEFSTLFVFYTDEDSSQWVTASPTGAGNEGGASVAVGEAPPDPATSAAGDLFWSSETGRLYVFAQGAWIDASPDGAAPGFWTRNGTTLSPVNENDSIALNGDITTAGRLLVSGLDTSDNSSRGLSIREVDANSFTAEIQAHAGVTTTDKAICVYKGTTDIWHVDYDGNASFRNATFKLEPDSSANYISTTNAEGETEAVYNGPVLSVLDELLDLRKRATQQDAVIAQLVTALRSQGVQIDTTDIQEDS